MKNVKQTIVLALLLTIVSAALLSSCSKSVDEPLPVPRPDKGSTTK